MATMLCALVLSLVHTATCCAPAQDLATARDVRFSVTAPDGRGPLYLAGTFNDWQPDDDSWMLAREKADGAEPWTLTVAVDRLGDAPIEFKLTRGSWDTVEVRADLADRPNRVLKRAGLPDEIDLSVDAWIDDRPGFVAGEARKSTVTGRLDIFDIASERLDNTRKLRVWLPPAYDAEENAEHVYPVLYMHDGQNVFDRATSFMGTEWGADESATRLIEAGKIQPLVIVGIDHAGANRIAEYNPPFTSRSGVAHIGDRYLDFVTQTVMPEIEKRYRIARGPQHTALGGSSYGGNITLYAGMRHPERFGGLLVESPIFWAFGSALMKRVERHDRWTQRVFVAIGTMESTDERVQDGYRRGMEVVRAAFAAQDLLPERALLIVEEDGIHHETAWARRLPKALEFLFAR